MSGKADAGSSSRAVSGGHDIDSGAYSGFGELCRVWAGVSSFHARRRMEPAGENRRAGGCQSGTNDPVRQNNDVKKTTMKTCLQIAGVLQLLLSVSHFAFARRLGWREDLQRVSLFTR